jgi:drug/metabolite transporter (DMT)-like permease
MGIDLVIFITLIAALITSFSQFMYKKGIKKRLNSLREVIQLFENRRILVGLAGYFLGLAVYLIALSQAPLSIVYPTFASTFIFITIISFALLKEKVHLLRVAGVLVIFFGIFLVSLTI